eukprot:133083-Pyramimonas_sp.AAC.1
MSPLASSSRPPANVVDSPSTAGESRRQCQRRRHLTPPPSSFLSFHLLLPLCYPTSVLSFSSLSSSLSLVCGGGPS